MREYLERQRFAKRLQKLYKKLGDKKILVYGTGKMFQEIVSDYDLKPLNIIGITDRKYVPEDDGCEDYGYKIIPYSKWHEVDVDIVLVAVQNYASLLDSIKKIFPNKHIIPFVPLNKIDRFRNLLSKQPFLRWCKQNKNNVVVLVKSDGKRVSSPKIKNLKIKFTGENNYVEIHEPFEIEGLVEIFGGSDNKVIIGANNQHRRTRVLMGSKNTLKIGRNTTVVGVAIHLFSAFNRSVTIGNDCQLSWDVMIRTTDAHTVYDINTREIINSPKDVYIGDHVWIAKDVTILKGTHISSNSIVGVASVVNKEFFEGNCIIAGTPAKVVKREVNWDRRGVGYFQ